MNNSVLARTSGVVFAVIAFGHLVRAAFRWEVLFAGWSVPIWVSVLIAILFGYLAYESFKRRPAHYVCTGGCGGVSSKPGACQAEGCAKKGVPLVECRI